MPLYAFELGRNKSLCLSELQSLLGKEALYLNHQSTPVFQLELSKENIINLQDRLGGTIKIIEIGHQFSFRENSPEFKSDLEKAIIELLQTKFKDHEGKVPFASSIYYQSKKSNLITNKEILNFSKKFLKKLKLNSRFINKNPHKNAASAAIYKAKTLEKGIDLNLIFSEKTIFLGHTLSIQNIDAYSKRDYEKPNRDAKNGMTPPKLAQIMINLAGESQTIYDPFCGTGTFLMEALLMGKNAIGSDLNPTMVNFSEQNCLWLKNNFKLKEENFRIFQRDARFLNKTLLPENIDAVISEGYLGEPITKIPSPEKREIIFRDLANLHLNWLTAINPLLKKKSIVVLCVAAFKIGNKIEHLPRFREIATTAGFKIEEQFTYQRPDQLVVRDIYKLEKI